MLTADEVDGPFVFPPT